MTPQIATKESSKHNLKIISVKYSYCSHFICFAFKSAECDWPGYFNCSQKLPFLEPSPVYLKSRAQLAGYTTLGLYALTSVGLYHLWYSNYDLMGFHYFNDDGEWLQMDKAGHTFSAYIAGRAGYNVCRWTGLDEKDRH